MNTLRLLTGSILIMGCLSCNNDIQPKSAPSTAKLEIIPASESGITFKNTLKDDPLTESNVLSYEYYFNGAGVGVADFNQDGLQDIFFAGNEVPNEIYINKGDFKFEKLGPESGINNTVPGVDRLAFAESGFDGFHS